MKCLIDGDIIAYSCAAACEGVYYEVEVKGADKPEHFKYKKDADAHVADALVFFGEGCPTKITKRTAPEPVEFCLSTVSSLLGRILERFQSNAYTIYLTGKNNFREELYPEYKANRKDVPKPTHLNAVREYLISNWGAVVVDGQEADDAMSIAQTKARNGATVICTTDKDLMMVPGNNYNWTKDELVTISKEEGLRCFYRQLLTGDATDNIPGIKGIGPKKAEKILEEFSTEKEMWDVVCLEWQKYTYPKGVKNPKQVESLKEEVIRNGRLLWMRRIEGEIWEPPISGEK